MIRDVYASVPKEKSGGRKSKTSGRGAVAAKVEFARSEGIVGVSGNERLTIHVKSKLDDQQTESLHGN